MQRKGQPVFVCQQCGQESLAYLGRCPGCGQWNTLLEVQREKLAPLPGAPGSSPQELSRLPEEGQPRILLALAEANRVLGGGLVPGSLVLLGGDPGIGKSTLLLQLAQDLAQSRGPGLYISGEESLHQIKLRSQRLGLSGQNLYLLAETDLESILHHLEAQSPAFAVIDSIQTVYGADIAGPPGSLSQVRECTLRLMRWAKGHNVPLWLAGHVTKDGAIAGPRTLEHMVDVVLYLEGEAHGSYRLLRSVKNRYGPTHEVGVLEMRDSGLVEVADPSRAFLAERLPGAVGSAVVPTMEGSRPLLVEIQALASPTPFPQPRRTANGVDFSRLLLVVAVLSRRLGLSLASQDIIVNVVGGLQVEEPAADLAIALAIASSARDVPLVPGLAVMGEVGLSGELRSVGQMERRLAEVAQLGFEACLLPQTALARVPRDFGLRLVGSATLAQAVRLGLAPKRGAGKEDSDGA
ncbi:MAG: DNA repair protein RadA [Chloroflexi bacterium]|nr:DNA repair protein RadA [Chloroflexota bacterium]